jgi:hypothetical protein
MKIAKGKNKTSLVLVNTLRAKPSLQSYAEQYMLVIGERKESDLGCMVQPVLIFLATGV